MSKTIPNSSVKAVLLAEDPKTHFAPIYLSHGDHNSGKFVASVNAGTSNAGRLFDVGLGGINGAFAALLGGVKQDVSAYKGIHTTLYNTASKSGKRTAFQNSFDASDPVEASMVQLPDASWGLKDQDGVVFVDIFNSTQVPDGNKLNYAMLYLIPPNRANYSDKTSFLDAVKYSSVSIVDALNQWNSNYAIAPLEKIPTIYMCLFSGGEYRKTPTINDTTVDEVAQHNLAGLEQGITSAGAQNSLEEVRFENSGKGFESIKSKLV